MKEWELKIEWENGESFTMQSKMGGGDWLTVLSVDENGNLASTWGNAEVICKNFFNKEFATISTEMKS